MAEALLRTVDAGVDAGVGGGVHVEVGRRTAAALSGAVVFVDPGARACACAELEASAVVVVRLEAIAVTSRGRLGEAIERALARALCARRARHTEELEDQIAAALEVGAAGVAVALGSLRALVDEDGALDAADSRTVRKLARASNTLPVVLLLDAADAMLGAYAAPVALGSIVQIAPRARAVPPPAPVEADATSDGDTGEGAAESTASATAREDASVQAEEVRPACAAEAATPAGPGAEREERRAAALPPPEVWRPWVVALSAARGPQPLASFERLFATSYLPLARAIEAGLDDGRANAACDEFRRTFARAYTEACPTFAVTGKRPRMVFDAPDVASRIARLHGARTTQLLLVDAMRFDLGLRVRDHLVRELGARVSLAEELILWSATPTTTARQLELLARGVDAMRAPHEAERDGDPLRGRTAETLRRVKIGHRDVLKLDAVQARISEPADASVLAEIPAQVADVIARHARTLSSRTLLFVFGDHGFSLDGNGALKQGGASPEEVLVGAFAFLVGAVH